MLLFATFTIGNIMKETVPIDHDDWDKILQADIDKIFVDSDNRLRVVAKNDEIKPAERPARNRRIQAA